jgi:phospholipase C
MGVGGWRGAAATVLLAGALGCGPGSSSGTPAPVPDGAAAAADAAVRGGEAGRAQSLAHVFVVAMENENVSQVYGDDADAPYINLTLIPAYARATEFVDQFSASVPSEPHYVWLEAGTNAFADHTFTTDKSPSASNSTASTAHLATQIADAGLSWTAYEEGIGAATGGCPISGSGFYAPKHDPFVFFQDVAGNPPAESTTACAAHMKPLTALSTDLAAGALARYVFITPDLCHDMHGASGCPASNVIKAGDDWLRQNVPPLLAFANAHAGVVFIVWDEGDASGHLPFLALGPAVKSAYAGARTYTHSSVLKTVEEILGLPILPTVTTAEDLSDLLQPGALPGQR